MADGIGDEFKVWTTVGSAGTLNQADLAKVSLHQSIIQLGPDISTNTAAPTAASAAGTVLNTVQAVVRYNVTPVDGLFIAAKQFKYGLFIRFRNRVTIKLMEVDFETGAEKQILQFDSQNPGNANVQVAGNFRLAKVFSKDDSAPLDFVNKGYYVEATLTAPLIATGSPAEISIIKIVASPDI
jgi:hypothetical protein